MDSTFKLVPIALANLNFNVPTPKAHEETASRKGSILTCRPAVLGSHLVTHKIEIRFIQANEKHRNYHLLLLNGLELFYQLWVCVSKSLT